MARMIRFGRVIPRDAFEGGITRIVKASDSTYTGRAHYVCDGVDDQVEINNAIQDLGDNGGVVRLTDGTFYITAPIEISKSGVQLVGQGYGTIIWLEDGSNCEMVHLDGTTIEIYHDNIANLILNMNGVGPTGVNPAILIEGEIGAGVHWWRINNVRMCNVTGDGIKIDGPSKWGACYFCDIGSCMGNGIKLLNTTQWNTFIGNNIHHITNDGINIDASSTNNVVSGNSFSNIGGSEVVDASNTYTAGLPLLEARSLAFGTWEKIYETTTTTGTSHLTISGLDGDTDKFYLVELLPKSEVNGYGFDLRINNDSGSNYQYQRIRANDTSIDAASSTSATSFPFLTGNLTAGKHGMLLIWLDAASGKTRTITAIGGSTENQNWFVLTWGRWTNTTSNITQLDFVCGSGVNTFGSGTIVRVFRLSK